MINRQNLFKFKLGAKKKPEDAPTTMKTPPTTRHSMGTRIVWDEEKQQAIVERINDEDDGQHQQQPSNNDGSNSNNAGSSCKRPLIAISMAPSSGTKAASFVPSGETMNVSSIDGQQDAAGSVDDNLLDNSSLDHLRLDNSRIVADVRENFLALIKYNRLQCFYLGVLIYSVINVILILNSITSSSIAGDERQQQQSGRIQAGRQKVFKQYPVNDGGDTNEFALDVNNDSGRISSKSNDCQNNSLSADSLLAEQMQFTSWLLIVFLLPATLLLILIVAFSFFDFQSIDWKSRDASDRQTINNHQTTRLQNIVCSIGVLLGFVLLILPISTIYLTSGNQIQRDTNRTNDCETNYTSSSSNSVGYPATTSHSPQRPPICLIVIIVYLLPYLLDELRLSIKLLCACVILPLILVEPIRDHINNDHQDHSNEQQLLILTVGCSIFAFLIGLIKRYQLNKFTRRKVFNGATESIEAKVSLEQQRQQQETLLLSVLPAYVAEQVKRNMVKKMMASQQQQESEQQFANNTNNNSQLVSSSSTLINNNNNGAENVPSTTLTSVSTVAATIVRTAAGGGQCARSYTLPMAQTVQIEHEKQQHRMGANHNSETTVEQQQQPTTNSVVRNSRLSSSLACEHQTTSPIRQQNQLQNYTLANSVQQQQHLPSTSSVNINFLPSSGGSQAARRGFNELYIRTYNNVSLLYGDIVGFTQLCTQLSSSQLVGVLNDLFSHFDHLAERNKIMRIKILGDCYYGVSGIPEFAVMGAKSRAKSSCDNHAINCVNMGLDMIQYIKCLNIRHSIMATKGQQQQHQNPSSSSRLSFINRFSGSGGGGGGGGDAARRHQSAGLQTSVTTTITTNDDPDKSFDQEQQNDYNNMPAFELNMRIGVHTGHIHSGVIGLKKWQFDIWSNDVSIAMHCESSGVAGRVQVTEATVQHLHGCFEFEPSPCSGRDQLLAEREIKTYLICDRVVVRSSNEQRQKASSTMTASGGQYLMAANHQDQSANTSAAEQCNRQFENGNHARIKLQSGNSKRLQRMHNSKQDEADFGAQNHLDEDKIREATIGTIRETLLAGETANSNTSNAYALALNHNDLDPVDLNFSESIMERSFVRRAVSIESRSIELVKLFLLLIVAISFLNLHHHFGADKNSDLRYRIVLLAFAILIGLFLLANLYLSLRTELMEQSSSDLPHTSSLSIGGRPSNDYFTSSSNKCPTINSNNNRDNSHDQNFIARKLSQASRVSARLNPKSFSLWKRKNSFTLIRRCSSNRLSLLAILLAYSTVIIEQIYIISSRLICQQTEVVGAVADWRPPPQAGHMNEQADVQAELSETSSLPVNHRLIGNPHDIHSVVEHYQITVILLLFAFDLCVNTISYKIKFRFLVAIIVLQSIILVSNPFEHFKTATATTAPFNQIQSTICKTWTFNGPPTTSNNSSEAAAPTAILKTTTTENYHRKNQQQQQQQLLIDRSTDALLLVLALWSLAFARQLDYTNRTNFLWRNRLNVDHEELEYISGINKVLLENILPSHVVQHYLSHPSTKPPTTTATATLITTTSANEPAVTSTKLNYSNTGYRLSLTKSASAELIRLSLNQMRNDELYHEQHSSVAVMFASIPHFYEFYDESDISKQGLGCIALLNEIICDFDRLLLKNKFSRIEKIKTIGSTYMAAAGLRPCHLSSARNSAASQISQQIASNHNSATVSPQLSCNSAHKLFVTTSNEQQQQSPALLASPMDERKFVLSQQKLNLICMIQFASSLMSALNGINKQSFQVFKLRVGINTGPVIAGVIGSQRPFYDIWGDCVNIASRMESLGEVGRIQVEEQTAQLLMECLCPDTYSIVKRGPINVKGKGGMVTYFVDKRPTTSCQQTVGIIVPTTTAISSNQNQK